MPSSTAAWPFDHKARNFRALQSTVLLRLAAGFIAALALGLTAPDRAFAQACGNGNVQGSEQCDLGAANGAPGSCCSATCTFVSAGIECRAATGTCDIAEQCTGSSEFCPSDTFQTAGTTCGDAGTECTIQDTCDGSGTCLDNGFEAAGTTCGDSTDTCLLYTSPSPRDATLSRMPSSA